MATLTINSTKVKVDDSFLSLSPEQQNATVDEIAASIGAQQQPAPTTDPGFNPYDTGATKLAGGPGVAKPASLLDSTMATVNGISASVPFLQNITDAIGGGVSQLTGGDYGQYIQHQKDVREGYAKRAPIARIAGEVGGNLAAVNALGATNLGGEALGMTGKWLPKLINSSASQAGISGLNSLSNGESGADVLAAMGLGGAFGFGGSAVGQGLGLGARAIGNKVAPLIGAIRDPAAEATRRAGMAFGRDLEANPSGMMNSMDEVTARANDVPVLNADRGGETVRALTRSVANQNPEARGIIEKVASDRYSGQAARAVSFIRRIAGGAVDDLKYQEASQVAAAAVNGPAYRAAYSSPQARAIWSPRIRQLMQAPEFLSAVRSAESAAKTESALAGVKPVKNPFVFNQDGTIADTLARQADGSTALPSLQFWDIVQRELRKGGEAAMRTGGSEAARPFIALRKQLLGELDGAVPAFKTARAGAASFFGADDALEAGKVFANQTRQLPEAQAAFAKMKPAEQSAFRTGYASEIIDKIKDARFRANVIDQAFGSPAKREMMALVFGPQKARELEAYVRVEELVDKLRGSLGNSTTARQLLELGIGAGSGALLSNGDWKGALGGAALARGGRAFGQKIDGKVMQEVAKLLMSGDQASVTRAIHNASMSPQWMLALQQIEQALGASSRAVVPVAAGAIAVGQN